MKRTIIALALFGMVGTAIASPAPKLKDIPVVAKCMEMHQFASIAHNSADPRDQADFIKYMSENFDDEQRWAYTNQINEWNKDPDIKATYNALIGPDIHGWSLTPAMQLAACIKVM